jgi:transcription termination/antitermination protein NusA
MGQKMNSELLSVFEYIEREKGVSRAVLIEAIETSLASASRRSFGHTGQVEIKIDPETADMTVVAEMLVVEGKGDEHETISLKRAREIKKDAQVGDVVQEEITPKDFGRIAAQTAKQVIIQKLREAEQGNILAEYEEQKGNIIVGVVRRHAKGMVILDLGRVEGILPPKEQIPVEKYPVGSRFSCLLLEANNTSHGPQIVLSRSHPEFVAKLFELEVPEIASGTVEIRGIAREAGYRAKVAVHSNDPKIDCVGACVGMRGARVKNIVRELEGEKVDIVRYDDDIATYVENALSPAKLNRIEIDDDEKAIVIFVDENQLSLSIGRKGQNARLTSKLLGWKVDIFAEKDGLVQAKDLDHKSKEELEAEAEEAEAVVEVSEEAEAVEEAETVEEAEAVEETETVEEDETVEENADAEVTEDEKENEQEEKPDPEE